MTVTTASKMNKNGIIVLMNRAFKGTPDYNEVSDFKCSDDTSIYLETDTDIEENQIPLQNIETVDDCETADWTESTDAEGETLNSSSYKEGTNSLNLGKDGTSSTTASYSKTTSSLNGTSKDLCLWVYVATLSDLATSNSITIRFGSDSSNYYQKAYDNADLTAGWNFFKIAITGGFDSTTGSPSISALDYSYIAFETTDTGDTITLGDLRMDYWHLVSSGDYFKALETGYPLISEEDLQVTIRGKLTTTEGNGHNISKVGFVNDDATRKLITGSNFDSYSKTNDDILIFEQIIRVRNSI